MNEELDIKTHKSVWVLFDDDTFKAFVCEFFYDSPYFQPEMQEYTMWDIYRCVFSHDDMYREFLQHCEMLYFPDIEKSDNMVITKVIRLLTFEKIRALMTAYKWQVGDILDINNNSVLDEALYNMVPDTDQDYFYSLLQSVEAWIPLNSLGQIIYTIDVDRSGHEVYSHERWKHRVTKNGQVSNVEQHFQELEQEFFEEYTRLQAIIDWFESLDFFDEASLPKDYAEFSQEKVQSWDTLNFKKVWFKFYIVEKLQIMQWELKATREINKGIGYLTLVPKTKI